MKTRLWSAMRYGRLVGLAALMATGLTEAAESPATAAWYETLRPGATRSEIERLIGGPLTARDGAEVWVAPQGWVEFQFRGEVLQRADHREPPDGERGQQLYATFGDPAAANLEARRSYLRGGDFAVMPRFTGPLIQTGKYPEGTCYEVDRAFLVIEPLVALGGGSGSLVGKAARVRLVDAAGKEKILYRADEHWRDLRPPGVSEGAVAKREAALKQLGTAALGRSVEEVLGPADSRMGSGRDFRLYYLSNGLALINVGPTPQNAPAVDRRRDAILGITILHPGSPSLATPFAEWLAGGAERTLK